MAFIEICAALLALASGNATATAAADADIAAYLAPLGYETIPLTKLRSRHESVMVEINGVTGLFILDSGAGASVIDQASLAKFNLDAALGEQVKAAGAGGNFAASRVMIGSFKIETISLAVETMAAGDLKHVVDGLYAANGVKIDGIIGQDILTNFGGIIDVGGQRLFVRAGQPEGASE